MSLNQALNEILRAIREEVAQNPRFKKRLEEALAAYQPQRRRARALSPAGAAQRPTPTPTSAPAPAAPPPPVEPAPAPLPPAAETLNPIALFSRVGEEGLRAALAGPGLSRAALAALVEEHNLDPAGTVAEAETPALIEQIVAQARKRVERDRRLFDY